MDIIFKSLNTIGEIWNKDGLLQDKNIGYYSEVKIY